MWIRVELMNLPAKSNSKKGRREENRRKAGFLQEAKRNILVWRNITDKSEGCRAELLPLNPLVKQDEMRTRLERCLNQQISRRQWNLATPPLLYLQYAPALLDNRSSFLMERPAQAKALADLWLPWILPSLFPGSPKPTPTHAVKAVPALSKGLALTMGTWLS